MSRALAVQWLFWFHAFEGWNRWHEQRGQVAAFRRPKPSEHY